MGVPAGTGDLPGSDTVSPGMLDPFHKILKNPGIGKILPFFPGFAFGCITKVFRNEKAIGKLIFLNPIPTPETAYSSLYHPKIVPSFVTKTFDSTELLRCQFRNPRIPAITLHLDKPPP